MSDIDSLVEEIDYYFGSGSMSDEEYLEHYGMPRRSGRYPWGSGKDDYQHSTDFLGRISILKKNGWKETPENIKKEFDLSVKEYRMEKSLCNNERRIYLVKRAQSLKEDGLTNSEIGRKMGVNESTVRSWFDKEAEAKMYQSRQVAETLKNKVNKDRMIDAGKEVERELNISREKLDTALYLLESQGYHIYVGRVPQPTNKNQMTTLKVLASPDVKHNEIYNYDQIKTITDYISRDGGQTLEKKFNYPASMDSKRLMIRYKEDGGIDKDGIVELRRGVPDLSLGDSRYAQVRILVDGTHYIKGMAVYSDDMPDGVDVVFNTNKSKDKSKMQVLKEIKKDPENPFGSAIKDADQGGQYWYDPKTGKRVSGNDTTVKNKKLGLINKRADEGDWSDWSDSLPSQFLSKQSVQMAKKQLDLAKANKQAEFDVIMSLNNPTIKKYYLDKFASSCDGAAVDLKAASLPGQKYHVIIPINSIGDDKVYAPNYKDGTKLALIRYPHGGTFEIPILTVDNKNPQARKLLGTDVKDAIGITKNVADRLSGADFDGDTVMCIPTHDSKGRVKITSTKPLEGLEGFDNKLSYGTEERIAPDGTKHYYRGDREIKIMKNTNTQMGIISNLITDMTLAGADDDELAAAVRHSMVVIDAEKHKLDYRKSEVDNNIAALQKKYQIKVDKDGNITTGGASTIVSRSKGEKDVPKRKGAPRINVKGKWWYDPNKPEGSLIYMTAPDKELYYADSKYDKKTGVKTVYTTSGKKIEYNMNDKASRDRYEPIMNKDSKTGEVFFTNKDKTITYRTKTRISKTSQMADTDDANTLVSYKRHPMELIYADYANSMKAMANNARIEMINTGNLKYDPTAKKIYAKEVSSLESKLNDALKNAIKERAAIRLASSEINQIKDLDPTMKPDDIRKVSQRSLTKYRSEVGSVSRRDRSIKITDKEWEAIQAGAITDNKLRQILNNSDPDLLRERAMPKATNSLSSAQINRIKKMRDSNFTLSQIAEKMGISSATVSKYLKGGV